MAITFEFHSARWVDPESPRSSLFRMTDAGNYVVHNKPKSSALGCFYK